MTVAECVMCHEGGKVLFIEDYPLILRIYEHETLLGQQRLTINIEDPDGSIGKMVLSKKEILALYEFLKEVVGG